MSSSLAVATGVVGTVCGAALQHWVSALREWWRPSPCPIASSPDISAAELRAWQDASLVSHLATGVSVGTVVSVTLVSIFVAASYGPRRDQATRPALTAAVTPAASAAPVHTQSVVPQVFDLAQDDKLDALEADEEALCAYVPVRR